MAANLLLTVLGVVAVAVPFNQMDWPAPLRRVQWQTADTCQNQLVFAAAQPTPFAQNEWPNPTLSIAHSDSDFARSLLATTLVVAPAGTPFTTTDWPVPPGQERAGEFAAERNLLLTVLTYAEPTARGPSLETRARLSIGIPSQVFTYAGRVTVYVGGAGETVFQTPQGEVHSFRGHARVRLSGEGLYCFVDPAAEIRRLDDELILML